MALERRPRSCVACRTTAQGASRCVVGGSGGVGEGSDIPGSGEPSGVEGWGWARTLSSMWYPLAEFMG